MTSLLFDNVSKVYSGAGERAVDNLTMHIKDGEIVALLGSSGCGKTTSLRMVAGLESVTDGAIRIGDRVVNTVRPSERNVAMAFETYALYPPLRVRENIAFGLLRDRAPAAEIEKQVKNIAAMLEITDLLERFPPSISGGAQQRVSLARALIRNAAVHLLDERDVPPRRRAEPARIVVRVPAHRVAVRGQLIPLLARNLTGFAANAQGRISKESCRHYFFSPSWRWPPPCDAPAHRPNGCPNDERSFAGTGSSSAPS